MGGYEEEKKCRSSIRMTKKFIADLIAKDDAKHLKDIHTRMVGLFLIDTKEVFDRQSIRQQFVKTMIK